MLDAGQSGQLVEVLGLARVGKGIESEEDAGASGLGGGEGALAASNKYGSAEEDRRRVK